MKRNILKNTYFDQKKKESIYSIQKTPILKNEYLHITTNTKTYSIGRISMNYQKDVSGITPSN